MNKKLSTEGNDTGYLTPKYLGKPNPNDCTLNGQLAVISWGEDFALVRQLGTCLGCEWSTAAAKRIMENGGHFKS